MTGKRWATVVTLTTLVLVAGGIACGSHATVAPALSATQFVTPLPPPQMDGQRSLESLLASRRSVREFEGTPLTDREIGQLLWAAQGVTSPRGFRTAPSAGALYPLEFYAVTAEGIFHYEPPSHSLNTMGRYDARTALFHAALSQEPIRQAPAVFVVAAVYQRTAQKYGEERSPRYVHLEAGHAAQNLLLQVVALDLGAVPIGAFDQVGVQEALGLPPDHEPLYLIPVGHPHDGAR